MTTGAVKRRAALSGSGLLLGGTAVPALADDVFNDQPGPYADLGGAGFVLAVQMPVETFGRPTAVRADGRVTDDLRLYRVKTPAQSHRPRDCYEPTGPIPASEALRPIDPAC